MCVCGGGGGGGGGGGSRVCVCVPSKQFLGTYSSYHHQTWQGNFLRQENASRVNYIEHLIMKIINLIISETVQAIPIKLAVKIVRRNACIICSQSDVLLHSRSQKRLTCIITTISRTVCKL